MIPRTTRGYMLVNTLVFASIAVVLVTSLVGWFAVTYRSSSHLAHREQAFQIAEAGIDYYRWHLAHWPTDYRDGTATSGPYVHEFEDKDGEVIGRFSLDITAPTDGSTIVSIDSTGWADIDPASARTIRVKMAIPSLAKFAVVANDEMRFGEGTEVFGPIHSNGGMRFDGLAHNLVSSSMTTYNDPDHSGSNEYAVHTHLGTADPLPPTALPARTDVFEAGRQVGQPAVNFAGITSTLSTLKSLAQTNGRYFSASGNEGYHIVFQTDDTFRLYRVNSQVDLPNNCMTQSTEGWDSWSIASETLLGTYSNPANGIIFAEDNVWVDGQINSARLTVAAARFPESSNTRRNIIINRDLLYTNYDGTDVIGLVAQRNVLVGLESEDDLRIDAALIAQNGLVGRFYYGNPGNSQGTDCDGYTTQSSLTSYGMIASNERYGFSYTDGTGYTLRTIIYDANLLYAPPPNFPLASDQYQTIFWEELE